VGFQVAGEALDIGPAGLEQPHMKLRRSSSYAWRVRPPYPARNPASTSRSIFVNTGTVGTSAADGIVVAIGHRRDRAETPKLGPPRPQQTTRTHGKTAPSITPCHRPDSRDSTTDQACARYRRIFVRRHYGILSEGGMQKAQFCAAAPIRRRIVPVDQTVADHSLFSEPS
jgi:hypothetical protein